MRTASAAMLLAVLAIPTLLAQTIDVLDVQAVPEATAEVQLLSRSSTAAGSYGSYGSTGGHGRYGSYGSPAGQPGSPAGQQVYGYGYGYGRSLREESVALEPSDPLLEYAEQQQAQYDAQQMAAQQAAGGVSAAAVAAVMQAITSRGSSSGSGSSNSSSRLVPVPAGRCYCRFDTDFNTWALAEDACKEALYARCQAAGPLPCAWLDAFFTPTKGPGHSLPHERDIKAFLHEDCSPQPPCACTGVKFDGTDSIPAAVACCRDLQVACLTPFNGVQCNKVEAFCHEDQPAPVLAAWSQHVLRHSDCSTYHGLPYELVTLQALQAAATGKQPAALTAHKDPGHEVPQQHETNLPEAVLLGQLLRNMEQQQQSTKEAGCVQQAGGSRAPQELLIALGAVAAGAVFVAIVAVVLAVRREEALPPITSATTTPARSASEVYQALVNSGGLAAPRPAACVGSGLSVGLQPPLQRDDSGDSCLSQVISIGHLRGGLREPLLHQSVSRCVSDASDASSSNSSASDRLP